MDMNAYYAIVSSRFEYKRVIQEGNFFVTQFYEEKFELKMFAMKLKMFSFLAYKPEVTARDIRAYSLACHKQSLQDYKGLPRGFQNIVFSFAVLATERVDASAAKVAAAYPPEHFGALEFPVIFDLPRNDLLYCRKVPLLFWSPYNGYLRRYAERHFSPR